MQRVPLVVIAILLLGACTRTPPAPAVRAAEPVAREPSASAPKREVALDPRTHGFRLGARYGYRVKLTTSVAFDGGAPSFDFDVTGLLSVVPTAIDGESARLYFSLAETRVVNRAQGGQSSVDELATELGRAGAFVTLAGGRAQAMDVPSNFSNMAMSTYRGLAAALQFARAEGDARRYSAEEYDVTGQYVADYELLPDGVTWKKTKRRYSGLLGAKNLPSNMGLRVLPEVIASSGEVRLSADGRPEHVSLADEIGIKGAQTPLRSRVAVELTATTAEPEVAGAAPVEASGLSHYLASEPLRPAEQVRALDDARIGHFEFDSLVAALEQRARRAEAQRDANSDQLEQRGPANEGELAEQSRQFIALAALLRRDRGAVTKAAAKIRAGSAASGDLLDALSSASSPEAQQALAALAAAKDTSPALRARIVFALARAQEPTPEGTQALRTVLESDPWNAGALYGLGTHARLYRDRGRTAEAAALGEFLLGRFRLKPGETSLLILLRAVANSGYDGALPEVTRRLADKRSSVRATAMRALQSMRNPRVDVILADRLEHDPAAEVQLAAIESAELRAPNDTFVGSLTNAALTAADPHVRYRSVELLSSWLDYGPAVRKALTEVAQRDDEPRVRERARAAL